MLWPFNHFRKPRLAPRGTIEAIYGMIVTQAREPLFYRDLGVPDTVNGRFDLLLMHLWLVLRRLKSAEAGKELSQALFDHFCNDMDDNLRELGVSDLKVPKRMQAFGEAGQATRSAVADVGGLRGVLSVQASFDVTPKRGGRFHVSGHVRARIGQTCVVTLEEIESEIDEPIDLIFAPPDQIPQMADLV